jgi:hypothetical protein
VAKVLQKNIMRKQKTGKKQLEEIELMEMERVALKIVA